MPIEPYFVLTDPTTFTILFPWGAEVHDKKTGELKKRVPEMGIPTLRQSAAFAGIMQLMQTTQDLRGAETLRVEAAKLLGTLMDKVTQEIQAAKPMTKAA
jgi:hypothetical protein